MSVITINGNTFIGNNVTIKNNKVIVDGKEVTFEDAKEINITVTGDIDDLKVDACNKVFVGGSVKSLATTSGDVEVNKDVTGNIKTTSGDIQVGGNAGGDVETISGDVTCGAVAGNIKTISGDVKHK